MIEFELHRLENGLEVVLHRDPQSTMSVVNILYKVGSRNELADKTGIAHLFEHLMFSGSKHAPDFDTPLQEAGGDNNAFTNSDITNYYDVIPTANIDTALWLEADRMQHLNLNEKSVDVQKKVVVEEFYETCLNKPYGDSWHHLSALAYKEYPYRWPTIGLEPDHITRVTIDDALTFYQRYYQPSNAILCIAGPLSYEKMLKKAQQYFGSIESTTVDNTISLQEPKLANSIKETLKKAVPSKQLFLAFPMPGRLDNAYYQYDLLSDVLGYGPSSRLYTELVKKAPFFTSINAYITGVSGPGLLIVEGRVSDSKNIEDAKAAVWQLLEAVTKSGISERELQKVKNKAISSMKFGDVSLLNKAMNLAYYTALGHTNTINEEEANYSKVTTQDIQQLSKALFIDQPHIELIYLPE